MLIKVSVLLKNVYGEPLKSQRDKPQNKQEVKDGKPREKEDLVLKDVMVNALLMEPPDLKPKVGDGEEKLRLYRLAIRIQEAKGDIDLSSKEIVDVKERIAKHWPPLISGQAWELIEPK